MKCLFCKIANEQTESWVYESKDAVAVLDIHPRAPGHAMVLPKIHAETILDLPDEKIGSLFEAVKNTTELLRRTLSSDGFTIGINHGKEAGQVIDHLHIHIIPRYKGDPGGSIHSVVSNPPKESLEEIRAKIKGTKS